MKRHIRFNGYLTDLFSIGYHFELNDDMEPYWVVSKYNNTIGFSGHDVVSVILVNATTGDIEEYDLDEVPSWVDRVHPKHFVTDQLTWWGEYVHGWFNFSNKDKLKLTPGTSLVYGNDGKCYYYSGISSVGRDGTALGFILTDTRDKSTTFFRLTGATEDKAMNSAEGAVQEKGYIASFPRPYNINGELTYVMSLKDKEGLIKKIAMVSVENYEVVSVGDIDRGIKHLMSDFITKINRYIGNDILNSSVKYIKHQGKVEYILHKNDYCVLMLQGLDSIGFKIYVDNSDEIEFTKEGDEVTFFRTISE